jgi:hypothetical protein
MSYALYLDDRRMPPNDGRNWRVARSRVKFEGILKEHGTPEHISFDCHLQDLTKFDGGLLCARDLFAYHQDRYDLDLSDVTFNVHSSSEQHAEFLEKQLQNFREADNG